MPGPGVTLEAGHRLRRDPVDGQSPALVDLSPEVLDQERDVLSPLAKRRHLEHAAAQAVPEIIAEGAALDRGRRGSDGSPR